MRIEIINDSCRDVINEVPYYKALSSCFRFIEGAAWDHKKSILYFSDIQGNALYTYSETLGVSLFRANSYLANGNTLDRQGRLITCEHGTSRVSRTNHDGTYEVMVSHYEGKGLNSPNDVVVKSNGMIYFTDPAPGRRARVGIPREQELSFQGVYMVSPESKSLTLLSDRFSLPNGLCFSLDEKKLYVDDTDTSEIWVFDVSNDGLLSNEKLFAKLEGSGSGVADGLKFNSKGILFCSAQDGVHIYNTDGTCIGKIHSPEVITNFTWGGEDMCTMFLTGTTTLYAIRVKQPGNRLY